MKINLTGRNNADLDYVTANGAVLDLSSFQVKVMLEFLIGDEREEAFNAYFNERLATLLQETRRQLTTHLLRAGNGKN